MDRSLAAYAFVSCLALACDDDAAHFPAAAKGMLLLDLCTSTGDCTAAAPSTPDAGLLACLPQLGSALRVGEALQAVVTVTALPESQERTLKLRADGSLRFGPLDAPRTEETVAVFASLPSTFHFPVHAISTGPGSIRVVSPVTLAEVRSERLLEANVSGFAVPRFLGLRGTQAAFFLPICSTAPAGTELDLRSFSGTFDNGKATVLARSAPECPGEYPRSASAIWVSRDQVFDAEVAGAGSHRSCQQPVTTYVDDIHATPTPRGWTDLGSNTAHGTIELDLAAVLQPTEHLVPVRGVAVSVSGFPGSVTVEPVPPTDVRGRTSLSITAPSSLRQLEVSLLIDQSFRRQLSVPGPALSLPDAGADAAP